MFEEHILLKFGDDRAITTFINDLSNLRATPNEKFKDFNSRFNKLLHKILDTSKPRTNVQIERYIFALP